MPGFGRSQPLQIALDYNCLGDGNLGEEARLLGLPRICDTPVLRAHVARVRGGGGQPRRGNKGATAPNMPGNRNKPSSAPAIRSRTSEVRRLRARSNRTGSGPAS